MITTTFIELHENRQYEDAMKLFLEQFQQHIKPRKLSAIRNLLNVPEESMKDVLKLMDLALMDQWSRILIKLIYRDRKSPTTTIWYCEELISEHKLVEAEELLKELEREELSPELAEKLYFCLAVALIHMQRFQEGYSYMEKCEKVSEDSMDTRWAYFYLNKGEWSKAIDLLEKGKSDLKDSALSYALLVQHYTEQGDMAKAESYLEEGLQEHPHYPKLMLEQVRLHYGLKQWNKMRIAIANLASISPFHDYQSVCDYFIAESYYEEEQLFRLQQHLAAHPELSKNTHFKYFSGNKDKRFNNIKCTSVVQKYNFCVPAVVQMALSTFTYECNQEEIAASIFDVAGSKISKTMNFLEDRGFLCRLFIGKREKFKRLVDQNAAVMMLIDYPLSSHVQLLTGYDDNLQVFHIQDPNFRAPHPLEYQHLEKTYDFAVAIVPVSEANKLQFLDTAEHERYKKLILLTENSDNTLRPEELMFITDNKEDPLIAKYSVKYLAGILHHDLLEKLIKVTEFSAIDSYYKNIIIAMAYAKVNKDEQATHYLDRVKSIQDSSYYYLKGRLFYHKGEYLAASDELIKAIKREPDDYVLWSYLALSTANLGQSKEALRISQIALDINHRDLFPLINHGMILYDNEQYEEA